MVGLIEALTLVFAQTIAGANVDWLLAQGMLNLRSSELPLVCHLRVSHTIYKYIFIYELF